MVLPGRKHLLSRRVSILPPQRLDRSASLIESDQFRRRELRQCGASRDLASVFLTRAARLFPKIEIGQQCSKHVAGSRVSFALATPMQRFLRVIQAHTEVIRTQSEVQVGTVHFQNSGCKHVTVMGVGCACWDLTVSLCSTAQSLAAPFSARTIREHRAPYSGLINPNWS